MSNQPSVLVVDDSLFMRKILTDILTQNSFEVIGEAQDGIEAIEKYQECTPDIVTLDITMPEMDGLEALKKIMEINPQAKVIMCSAMGQQGVVTDAINAGAKDFIIKPFQPHKIIKAIQQVMEDMNS